MGEFFLVIEMDKSYWEMLFLVSSNEYSYNWLFSNYGGSTRKDRITKDFYRYVLGVL